MQAANYYLDYFEASALKSIIFDNRRSIAEVSHEVHVLDDGVYQRFVDGGHQHDASLDVYQVDARGCQTDGCQLTVSQGVDG